MSHYDHMGDVAALEAAKAAKAATKARAAGTQGDTPPAASGDGEKKFPIIPVAIGAAALAAILLMRKK
jgi:hypothetical protein